MLRHNFLPPTLLLACVAFAGCSTTGQSGFSSSSLQLLPAQAKRAAAAQKIQHVIILIQENRSFDDLFATYPGADGTRTGIGKCTVSKTCPKGTVTIRLKGVKLDNYDLPHSHGDFLTEYDDGNMDGFNQMSLGGTGKAGAAGNYPYQYVFPSEIKPYWTMAQQYALADHMFQTQGSGSFVGHQDLIAGSTSLNADESVTDDPSSQNGFWGCDSQRGPHGKPIATTSLISRTKGYEPNEGPFPCFSYATLRDSLDGMGLSWKYYEPAWTGPASTASIWSAFDAIKAVRYGPEWGVNVNGPAGTSTPETQVMIDAANGTLSAVSWVVPDAQNSDHPSIGDYAKPFGDTGPAWIAQVVNSVGEGPEWNTTAIIVIWDDWGGFYDHEKPPQLDYQGLGFRVPMLLISPYARAGYISHTQYEPASILKFIENNWGLARIGVNDVRATDIGGMFNLNQRPRKFVEIKAKYSRDFFLHEKSSGEPVDTE